jgi:hypothetical protein
MDAEGWTLACAGVTAAGRRDGGHQMYRLGYGRSASRKPTISLR